jgi:hypothetical protein
MTSAFRIILLALSLQQTSWAQAERTRQQIPNLDSLPDVTVQLQTQIDRNDGNLVLAGAEQFRITKPLVFDRRGNARDAWSRSGIAFHRQPRGNGFSTQFQTGHMERTNAYRCGH